MEEDIACFVRRLEAKHAELEHVVDAANRRVVAAARSSFEAVDQAVTASQGAITGVLADEKRLLSQFAAAHGVEIKTQMATSPRPPRRLPPVARSTGKSWNSLARSTGAGHLGVGFEWQRNVLLAVRQLLLDRLRTYATGERALVAEDVSAIETLKNDVHAVNAAILRLEDDMNKLSPHAQSTPRSAVGDGLHSAGCALRHSMHLSSALLAHTPIASQLRSSMRAFSSPPAGSRVRFAEPVAANASSAGTGEELEAATAATAGTNSGLEQVLASYKSASAAFEAMMAAAGVADTSHDSTASDSAVHEAHRHGSAVGTPATSIRAAQMPDLSASGPGAGAALPSPVAAFSSPAPSSSTSQSAAAGMQTISHRSIVDAIIAKSTPRRMPTVVAPPPGGSDDDFPTVTPAACSTDADASAAISQTQQQPVASFTAPSFASPVPTHRPSSKVFTSASSTAAASPSLTNPGQLPAASRKSASRPLTPAEIRIRDLISSVSGAEDALDISIGSATSSSSPSEPSLDASAITGGSGDGAEEQHSSMVSHVHDGGVTEHAHEPQEASAPPLTFSAATTTAGLPSATSAEVNDSMERARHAIAALREASQALLNRSAASSCNSTTVAGAAASSIPLPATTEVNDSHAGDRSRTTDVSAENGIVAVAGVEKQASDDVHDSSILHSASVLEDIEATSPDGLDGQDDLKSLCVSEDGGSTASPVSSPPTCASSTASSASFEANSNDTTSASIDHNAEHNQQSADGTDALPPAFAAAAPSSDCIAHADSVLSGPAGPTTPVKHLQRAGDDHEQGQEHQVELALSPESDNGDKSSQSSAGSDAEAQEGAAAAVANGEEAAEQARIQEQAMLPLYTSTTSTAAGGGGGMSAPSTPTRQAQRHVHDNQDGSTASGNLHADVDVAAQQQQQQVSTPSRSPFSFAALHGLSPVVHVADADDGDDMGGSGHFVMIDENLLMMGSGIASSSPAGRRYASRLGRTGSPSTSATKPHTHQQHQQQELEEAPAALPSIGKIDAHWSPRPPLVPSPAPLAAVPSNARFAGSSPLARGSIHADAQVPPTSGNRPVNGKDGGGLLQRLQAQAHARAVNIAAASILPAPTQHDSQEQARNAVAVSSLHGVAPNTAAIPNPLASQPSAPPQAAATATSAASPFGHRVARRLFDEDVMQVTAFDIRSVLDDGRGEIAPQELPDAGTAANQDTSCRSTSELQGSSDFLPLSAPANDASMQLPAGDALLEDDEGEGARLQGSPNGSGVSPALPASAASRARPELASPLASALAAAVRSLPSRIPQPSSNRASPRQQTKTTLFTTSSLLLHTAVQTPYSGADGGGGSSRQLTTTPDSDPREIALPLSTGPASASSSSLPHAAQQRSQLSASGRLASEGIASPSLGSARRQTRMGAMALAHTSAHPVSSPGTASSPRTHQQGHQQLQDPGSSGGTPARHGTVVRLDFGFRSPQAKLQAGSPLSASSSPLSPAQQGHQHECYTNEGDQVITSPTSRGSRPPRPLLSPERQAMHAATLREAERSKKKVAARLRRRSQDRSKLGGRDVALVGLGSPVAGSKKFLQMQRGAVVVESSLTADTSVGAASGNTSTPTSPAPVTSPRHRVRAVHHAPSTGNAATGSPAASTSGMSSPTATSAAIVAKLAAYRASLSAHHAAAGKSQIFSNHNSANSSSVPLKYGGVASRSASAYSDVMIGPERTGDDAVSPTSTRPYDPASYSSPPPLQP